jgi:hypothetical protein
MDERDGLPLDAARDRLGFELQDAGDLDAMLASRHRDRHRNGVDLVDRRQARAAALVRPQQGLRQGDESIPLLLGGPVRDVEVREDQVAERIDDTLAVLARGDDDDRLSVQRDASVVPLLEAQHDRVVAVTHRRLVEELAGAGDRALAGVRHHAVDRPVGRLRGRGFRGDGGALRGHGRTRPFGGRGHRPQHASAKQPGCDEEGGDSKDQGGAARSHGSTSAKHSTNEWNLRQTLERNRALRVVGRGMRSGSVTTNGKLLHGCGGRRGVVGIVRIGLVAPDLG